MNTFRRVMAVPMALTALALAISSIAKPAYVAFRENRLTHLLKDSLTPQVSPVLLRPK